MSNNNNNMKMPKFRLSWVYLIAIGAMLILFYTQSGVFGGSFQKEVTYSVFQNYVRKGYARNIVVNKGDGNVVMYVEQKYVGEVFAKASEAGSDPSVTAVFSSVDNVDKFLEEEKNAKHFNGDVEYKSNDSILGTVFFNIIVPLLLFGFIFFFLFRRGGGGAGGGGIFSVGKSKAQLYEKGKRTEVTFKDVAGQDEAKQEVQEIVKFLKDPKKYTELGGKIPKGALLVGPPGTGKTLLAKAVAGEANVPFFSLSGSDFVEMFVGVGASRVRDLFHQAKEKAPCIVFIDEIDAVGRARGKSPSMGGNDERESTLNQLLTEMDGFGTNSGIIVMAATNRADILDKALLRAGRFDRQIHVELPGLPERKQIFAVHMKPIKNDETVDIDLLARQTPGFSGADIANVCNEAALIAARKDKKAVDKQDFLDAIDRIIGGLEKKTKVMTQDEKRTIALHEAGHATVSWFCQYADPLVKVTIVPRGQALGAAWYLPEERVNLTKQQMLDKICSLLGGRAAEELFVGSISTGALSDLERANKMAFGMIAYYGMSDNLFNVSYYNTQTEYFQKPYSDLTAQKIDDEVKALLAEQYERAKQILQERAEGHAQVAKLLMDNEVIFADDVENVFGKRQWTSRNDQLIAENERLDKERQEAELREVEAKEAQQKAELDALIPELANDGGSSYTVDIAAPADEAAAPADEAAAPADEVAAPADKAAASTADGVAPAAEAAAAAADGETSAEATPVADASAESADDNTESSKDKE